MSSITITENNKENIKLPEIGTRTLTDDQLQSLKVTLRFIFHGAVDFTTLNKMALKIAGLFVEEDIKYKSALDLWQYLEADIEILQAVYTDPTAEKNQTTLPFLKILTENGENLFDPKEVRKAEQEVLNTIQRPKHEGMVIGSLGTDTILVIDPRSKTVKIEHIKEVNGKDYSRNEIIIKGYPTELIVYDNPVANETRQFQCTWKSTLSNRPLRTGPAPIADIAEDLSASGYIINKRKGEDALKSAFNTLIEHNLATMKSEVETPGFYYNELDGSITIVKYDLPSEVNHDLLKQGVKTFEEYASYFEDRLDKMATVFKWGLIAPFIFAIKQMGGWVKWPYLYGNGGTGKSKGFADLVLYMWNEPDNTKNDFGGSGFDTEARVGEKLKLSTFPIAVAEPGGLFERKGPSELIKTAIEQITSRGKFHGKHYKTIPAYASVIFTANQKYPDDDAFDRRLWGMLFTRTERKTEQEKEHFNKTFLIENKKLCRLHDLKAIAHYIAIELCNEPSLLAEDWQDTINKLLVRLYTEIGFKIPEWLLAWSKIETMEDMDELHKERIRIFLQKQINREYGRIEILDEEGRPQKKYNDEINVKTGDDFINRVWVVLNNRSIPWLLLDNKDNVCITMGFIDGLLENSCVKDSLQGIAESVWMAKIE